MAGFLDPRLPAATRPSGVGIDENGDYYLLDGANDASIYELGDDYYLTPTTMASPEPDGSEPRLLTVANGNARYLSQDPALIGNTGSAWWTALLVWLRTLFVRKGELVFNVKDYGATGNGTTDDTAAIQAAMDAVKAAGGGTLWFPPGTYYMYTYVVLCDNVTITGKGATIRKLSTSYSYVCFASFSGANQGYGSGANNVTCHGLTFRGSFSDAAPRGLCAFSLHHAKNFLAYNLRFTECAGQGHQFDIGGSDGIVVRDSLFEGFRTEFGALYNECVQVDVSQLVSSSVPDANTAYDGLPTKNVTVENCRFMPLTIGAKTYPAPIPVGSHGQIEGQYYTNIVVRGNIIDTTFTDTTSGVPGILHFYGVDGITIEKNTIINRGSTVTRAIYMPRANVVQQMSQLINPAATTVSTTDARVPKNVRITGNTFIGFNATDSGSPIIGVYGDQGLNQAENVVITGNTFKDCHEPNLDVGTGPICISIADAIRVTVDKNNGSIIRRLTDISRGTQVEVNNNKVVGAYAQVLNFISCVNFSAVGNKITDYNSTAIQALGAGSIEAFITGNAIKGQRADTAGRAILVRQTTNAIVNGNILKTTTGTAKGIDFDTSSTGVALNNIITGFTTPVKADATSTATTSDAEVYPTHATFGALVPPLTNTSWSTVSFLGEFLYVRESTVQNASITYEFPGKAGKYDITLAHRKSSNRGQYDVYIDGILAGANSWDGYNATVLNTMSTVQNFTVTTSGRHTLELRMATKNASSTGYVGSINAVHITRTGD